MPHIDEGALHAYLDGALDSYPASEAARIRAHLDSCDECAHRLEEERAIREEAESILAPSAPVVQMPPLEELRAVAKRRTEASHVRGMSRVTRWGWAASVVLALGSGWMLRGAIPGMISRPTLPEQMMEPGVTTPAADATSDEAFRSEEVRQQDAPGAGEATDPVVGDESDLSAAAATVGVADEDVAAGVEALAEEAAARDAPADAQEAVAPPPSAAAPALTQDLARFADSLAGARVSGVLDSVTSPREAEEPAVARREAQPAEAAPEPSPVVEGRSRGAVQLRAAFERRDDVAAAKSMLGLDEAGSLVVPDLQVIEIVGVQDAPVDDVVLVRQLMENGDTLQILHLPPGSDPAAFAPAPSDGRAQWVAARGEGWIILRAYAAESELEAYSRRLLGS